MWGTYVHLCTKYKVSTSKGEVCTDNTDADDANTNNANDRQSMIVQGSLVDKPNKPKTRVYQQKMETIMLENKQ